MVSVILLVHYFPYNFRSRAMFDIVDMPWAWPVDTNYHEARAYCLWKGPKFRLLVEAEHNVIRGSQVSQHLVSPLNNMSPWYVQFDVHLC